MYKKYLLSYFNNGNKYSNPVNMYFLLLRVSINILKQYEIKLALLLDHYALLKYYKHSDT